MSDNKELLIEVWDVTKDNFGRPTLHGVYYVDGINGNDSNSGSPTSPLLTTAEAYKRINQAEDLRRGSMQS